MKHKSILRMSAISIGVFSMLLLISSLPSCSADYEEDIIGGIDCDTTVTMSLATHVKPILDQYCLNCHSTSANFGGVKLESYQDLKEWVDSGLFLSSIVHDGNASPMPKSQPKLGDCDISKITAWINQGALNN